MSVQSLKPPEPPSVVDPRLADLRERMCELRWAVEDIASDAHRQIDLLMRRFGQLERSLEQSISQPPAQRR